MPEKHGAGKDQQIECKHSAETDDQGFDCPPPVLWCSPIKLFGKCKSDYRGTERSIGGKQRKAIIG